MSTWPVSRNARTVTRPGSRGGTVGLTSSAAFPFRPGGWHRDRLRCCVATGETVEEVEELLREAIALHVAGLREDGLPVPEPSSVVAYLEVSA